MGALIHLAAPLQADPAASRVYYFTGRSLSATDLALEGSYTDWRLLGLVPSVTGVISGLGVTPTPATGVVAGRYDSPDGTTGLASLTIGAGAGIGADGRLIRLTAPMTVAWTTLLQSINPAGSIADGIYLLLLRTAVIDGLEGPPPDPCAQGTSDKLLDIRPRSARCRRAPPPRGARWRSTPWSAVSPGRALPPRRKPACRSRWFWCRATRRSC
jgi:hypothetical protein